MRDIPRHQVVRRLRVENPWWESGAIPDLYGRVTARPYLDLLWPLVREPALRRAVVLMGPRRVGKTWLVHHTIARLLEQGVDPRRVFYVSVDHPLYVHLGLEDLLELWREETGIGNDGLSYVFFDEVQYLRDWELHLKSLVDGYPALKVLASGSAAAALRLKSAESGAGRFTDFLLPPLTFYEFLSLTGNAEAVEVIRPDAPDRRRFEAVDIDELNDSFVEYLNFGGYPEVVVNPIIRSDPSRFVRSDILDKVIQRDLPSLYGIQDIQELNSLFTTLAFHTAQETSLQELAQRSNVARATLRKYIEYLQAAFLIQVVDRVDQNAKRFKRRVASKVYLTSPSLFTALFSAIDADDPEVGHLVETAAFTQWFHAEPQVQLRYARFRRGRREVELDMVRLDRRARPYAAVEVKWSDRSVDRPQELTPLLRFCRDNNVSRLTVTTRTQSRKQTLSNVEVRFQPSALYCYEVGYRLINDRLTVGER